LGAFYYFKIAAVPKVPGTNTTSVRLAAGEKVLELNKGEHVTQLALRIGPGGVSQSSSEAVGSPENTLKVVLQQANGGIWHLTDPVSYPAESLVVDGLVSLLRLTQRLRVLSFEGLEASEFGFEDPRLFVCVMTDRLERERCLRVGSQGAVGEGAYARWDDEDTFFLVPGDFVRAFDKSLYSLRRKQIFSFTSSELGAIQFQLSHPAVEIRRVETGWEISKPEPARIESPAVGKIVEQLNHLYVKEFLDEGDWGDPKLGLGADSRLVRVTFSDGSTRTLSWGLEAPGRDAYYARIGGEKTVVLVSLGRLKEIEATARAVVTAP